jgi:hypothetical protein
MAGCLVILFDALYSIFVTTVFTLQYLLQLCKRCQYHVPHGKQTFSSSKRIAKSYALRQIDIQLVATSLLIETQRPDTSMPKQLRIYDLRSGKREDQEFNKYESLSLVLYIDEKFATRVRKKRGKNAIRTASEFHLTLNWISTTAK